MPAGVALTHGYGGAGDSQGDPARQPLRPRTDVFTSWEQIFRIADKTFPGKLPIDFLAT